jgi:hypothetical protein
MNIYDYIEDYLNEELRGAALGAFEQALQNDAELRLAVERHREMLGKLHALRLREKIKKNLVSSYAGSAKSTSVSRRFLAVAAAFVLLAAATLFWLRLPKGTEPQAVADPAAKPPDTSTAQPPSLAEEQPLPVGSREQTRTPPRSKGKTLANDPNGRIAFVETIRTLEYIEYGVMGETQKDGALENKLNTAIGYLKAEKPSKAVPLLENVLMQNNTLYQEDAEWLLALSKLGLNTEAGKEALEAIAQNPAHAYRRRAMSLLGKLE